MRVISGKARHISLITLEGHSTRPTTDRIKETLFNMLQNEIPGSRFLDLFAGSGGIGIEALSRGARSCVFVEKNPKAVACIRENLKKTGLTGGQIINADVFSFLDRMKNGEPYDIIFMDPPYGHLFEKQVIERLAALPLADENTLIIFEASIETEFNSYVGECGFEVVKVKTYKTNQHVFLKRTGREI